MRVLNEYGSSKVVGLSDQVTPVVLGFSPKFIQITRDVGDTSTVEWLWFAGMPDNSMLISRCDGSATQFILNTDGLIVKSGVGFTFDTATDTSDYYCIAF